MSLTEIRDRVLKGGDAKYHQKNKEIGKFFARERVQMLCDENSFEEDGLLANQAAPDLPADGVVTGIGKVFGVPVAVAANDSTVKAGSWGARTVEKILRLQEKAIALGLPVFYLVDSAGARITDQVEMFPGRRGAGKIFYNQSNLSGVVPQICLLFGPSAAGGAYIPAFCDVVIMVEGNASMYLGSPRMAESVIGEKVTLEEMGGARMHCSQSGCGDFLAANETEAIEIAKKYFSFAIKKEESETTAEYAPSKLKGILPEMPQRAYDMREVIKVLADKETFFEIKKEYAKEILTGFARLEGQTIGIVANQPSVKGGVLFAESANKAARFIQICNAYRIPILFLADVPGFMIGSKVEKEGIIRGGAKMIYALSNAKVAKICLVVRKAYGAGLYAMCGPAFEPDCVLALPTAQIAVMGPEPAINAVYYNKLAEMDAETKTKFIKDKTAEYLAEVDILRLGSELVVDDVIEFETVRKSLSSRFSYYTNKSEINHRLPGIMPM